MTERTTIRVVESGLEATGLDTGRNMKAPEFIKGVNPMRDLLPSSKCHSRNLLKPHRT